MSTHNRVLDLPFRAAANFDTTTADHVCVNVSADQTVALRTTVSAHPIGILQNGGVGGVLSGGVALVRVLGTSKLQFNDSITIGVPFRVNTLGLGLPLNNATVTGGNQFIGGVALGSITGASITGAVIEVLWAPFAAARSDSLSAI